MNRFLKYIEKKISKVAVLEISPSELFNGVVLIKKKNEIILDRTFENASLFDLKKYISTSTPILLVFQNDNVITKVRNSEDKLSFEEEAHFLIQKNYLKNGTTIVSAIKKENVTSLVEVFKNHIVLDYSIGVGDVSLLKEQEIVHQKYLETLNQRLSFSESSVSIENSKKLPEQYRVGDDIILSTFLLPYASGLSFFFKKPNKSISKVEFQEKGIENFGYSFSYSKLLIPLTILFIVAFLFTFSTLSNYQEKKDKQASEIDFLNNKQTQLKQLEKEYKTKLTLMNQFGIKVNQDMYASQLDWIGHTLTSNIILTEIQYHPINENNISNNKKTEIESNKIIIKGNTKEIVGLNRWIERLKDKENIAKITILYFDEQRDQSNFSIELKTRK